MRGLRLIGNLDLTFHAYGHLTRDGRIIGLVFEQIEGRMVDYRDRSLVYEAYHTLKRHNITIAPDALGDIYRDLVVVNGKLRFFPESLVSLIPRGPRNVSNSDNSAPPSESLLETAFKKLSLFPDGNPVIPHQLDHHEPLYLAQIPSPSALLRMQGLLPPYLDTMFRPPEELLIHRPTLYPRDRPRKGLRALKGRNDHSSFQKATPLLTSDRHQRQARHGRMQGTQSTSRRTSRRLLLANDEYDDDSARFHEVA
ncbi:hypothetical protein VNI00_007617 [Paramarasmius palmivorus]|uniref:Uncharacterized protein n=1 Tax=Paramarasmius palmivorus TaxID=297713 RepID=A0AAW0CZQ4_9AGAR